MTQFPCSSSVAHGADAKACEATLESQLASLKQWFRADISVLDPHEGRTVHTGEMAPRGDLAAWSEICKEVIRRSQPECIAEAEPVIVLAIPLAGGLSGSEREMVAIAPFLVRSCELESVVRRAGVPRLCCGASRPLVK